MPGPGAGTLVWTVEASGTLESSRGQRPPHAGRPPHGVVHAEPRTVQEAEEALRNVGQTGFALRAAEPRVSWADQAGKRVPGRGNRPGAGEEAGMNRLRQEPRAAQ